MNYIAALTLLHKEIRPVNYFEIGNRFGHSLSLSSVPSIGVDPDFEISSQLSAPTRLFKMTSDAFFSRPDVCRILGGPIDFAFVDGLHVVEFALRDFMNIERYAGRTSVIAIDDVLPQHMDYATRERNTQIWCGDVYRLILILMYYRPDLEIRIYDIEMKGLAIVSKLDPSSRVLADNYSKIVEEIAVGKWSCSTVNAIRQHLQPRSDDALVREIQALAEWRRRPVGGEERSDNACSLYLDLLKRSILNELYLDDELRILYLRACLDGKETFQPSILHDIRNARRNEYERLLESRKIGRFFDNKIQNCGFVHSMVGRARLENLHASMDIVRTQGIVGDVIECGVWRGGACLFMAGYLRAHDMEDRRVFVADSFEGLPRPALPQDRDLDLSKDKFPELAISIATVQENFSVYGLDRKNVVYLKGWFKDTLPQAPINDIALLRLDGDLYESTMDILAALYDKISPGGVVIIDDYALPPCRAAVHDFFKRRNHSLPEVEKVDHTGVWFRKV